MIISKYQILSKYLSHHHEEKKKGGGESKFREHNAAGATLLLSSKTNIIYHISNIIQKISNIIKNIRNIICHISNITLKISNISQKNIIYQTSYILYEEHVVINAAIILSSTSNIKYHIKFMKHITASQRQRECTQCVTHHSFQCEKSFDWKITKSLAKKSFSWLNWAYQDSQWWFIKRTILSCPIKSNWTIFPHHCLQIIPNIFQLWT